MCVEYCEGIAEDLVGGKIKPWSCSLNRENVEIISNTTPTKKGLGKDKLKEIASISLQVEDLFGEPQDIEWAYAGGSFILLQARPITRKQSHVKDGIDSLWTRANIGEVLPGPVTPLTWHVFRATLGGRPDMLIESDKEASANGVEGIQLKQGRAYIRLVDFWNRFCYLPFVTPEMMNKVLGVPIHSDSMQYRRPAGAAVYMAKVLFLLNLFGIVPRIQAMVKRLPSPPPASFANLHDLIKWNTRCFQLHLKVTVYNIAAFSFIYRFLGYLLPSCEIDKLSAILTGREDIQSSLQGIELMNMAEKINAHPHARSVFLRARDWRQAERGLMKVMDGMEFVVCFQRFLESHGARAAGEFELSIPRWIENPQFPFEILRQYIKASDSGSLRAVMEKQQIVRTNMVGCIQDQLGFFHGLIFKRLLNSYSSFATMRENLKYRLMEGSLALRRVFIDIGNTLKEDDLLERPDDIFYLTPREANDLLNAKGKNDYVKNIIHEKKREIKQYEKIEVNDFIDDKEYETMDSPIIKGIGCSSGIVEGKARVLKNIDQAYMLQPGEILVTHHTDPGWAPLFLVCGGLVAEIGGFLSHGATVAREYGIPAVVNATAALKKIKNGNRIRVDGSNGIVLLCDK